MIELVPVSLESVFLSFWGGAGQQARLGLVAILDQLRLAVDEQIFHDSNQHRECSFRSSVTNYQQPLHFHTDI